MSHENTSRLSQDSAPDPRGQVGPPGSGAAPLAKLPPELQPRRDRRLMIHARFRERLAALGLTRVEEFLALPGLIVSGHVDRNVSRVHLGTAPGGLTAYLKREHCRPWKEMLVNLLSGFGWISRSRREALMLQEARNAGVAVPDWLAAGEDEQGRAFLLVRGLNDVRDLRDHLAEFPGNTRERRSFASRLGAELARMHDHGFEHRDLYANHLLIDNEGRIQIIDWQRARHWRSPLTWSRRIHELACLDATLGPAAATRSDRLACLRAYVAETRLPLRRRQLERTVRAIVHASRQLLGKRHIRALRATRPGGDPQHLIWLEGESCCVTPGYLARLHGKVPDWLRPVLTHSVHPRLLTGPRGPRALALVRRHTSQPMRWLFACLRRRPLRCPEMQQAELLFRCERHGIEAPRLLAFGQNFTRPWRAESFVLAETDRDAEELLVWLHRQPRPAVRRRVVKELGKLLRRLHDIDCVLDPRQPVDCLAVRRDERGGFMPLLGHAGGLCKREPGPRQVRRDLAAVLEILTAAHCPRGDRMRFLVGYFGHRALAPGDRLLAALLKGGR